MFGKLFRYFSTGLEGGRLACQKTSIIRRSDFKLETHISTPLTSKHGDTNTPGCTRKKKQKEIAQFLLISTFRSHFQKKNIMTQH